MWFESRTEVIALLLIFFTLIIEGHALKCFYCNDLNCDSGWIELDCTTEFVLDTHESLFALNPSLESVAPANVDYACFQLNSSIVLDNGNSIAIVDFGCTFRQTTFCDGWDDDVVLHECQLCHTDSCNTTPANTPDPPGSSTTTAANPDSTGGVDSKMRTGTKLVIGGLCLILFFL